MKLFRKSLSILVAVFLLFGVYTMPAQALTADDSSRDYLYTNMTISAKSEEIPGNSTEGPVNFMIDNNPATFWHTDWQSNLSVPNDVDGRTVVITLAEEVELDALRYLSRPSDGSQAQPVNGQITQYRVEVSTDNVDWTVASQGTWTVSGGTWFLAEFTTPMVAKYVKLVGVETYSDGGRTNHFASGAEVRVRLAIEPHTVEESRTEPIPFETVRENDPTLLVGQEVVETPGVNGVKTIYENVTYRGEEVINTEFIREEITTAPVTQVVKVGTMVAPPETTSSTLNATFYSTQNVVEPGVTVFGLLTQVDASGNPTNHPDYTNQRHELEIGFDDERNPIKNFVTVEGLPTTDSAGNPVSYVWALDEADLALNGYVWDKTDSTPANYVIRVNTASKMITWEWVDTDPTLRPLMDVYFDVKNQETGEFEWLGDGMAEVDFTQETESNISLGDYYSRPQNENESYLNVPVNEYRIDIYPHGENTNYTVTTTDYTHFVFTYEEPTVDPEPTTKEASIKVQVLDDSGAETTGPVINVILNQTTADGVSTGDPTYDGVTHTIQGVMDPTNTFAIYELTLSDLPAMGYGATPGPEQVEMFYSWSIDNEHLTHHGYVFDAADSTEELFIVRGNTVSRVITWEWVDTDPTLRPLMNVYFFERDPITNEYDWEFDTHGGMGEVDFNTEETSSLMSLGRRYQRAANEGESYADVPLVDYWIYIQPDGENTGYEVTQDGNHYTFTYVGLETKSHTIAIDWTNVPVEGRTPIQVVLTKDGVDVGEPISITESTYTWENLEEGEYGFRVLPQETYQLATKAETFSFVNDITVANYINFNTLVDVDEPKVPVTLLLHQIYAEDGTSTSHPDYPVSVVVDGSETTPWTVNWSKLPSMEFGFMDVNRELDYKVYVDTEALAEGYEYDVTNSTDEKVVINRIIPKHTVTYDPNGGTRIATIDGITAPVSTPISFEVEEGPYTTLSVNSTLLGARHYGGSTGFQREGYYFTGWKIVETGEVLEHTGTGRNFGVHNITLTEDITLEAQWIPTVGRVDVIDHTEGYRSATRTINLVNVEDGTVYTSTTTTPSEWTPRRTFRFDEVPNGSYIVEVYQDGVKMDVDWANTVQGTSTTTITGEINENGDYVINVKFYDQSRTSTVTARLFAQRAPLTLEVRDTQGNLVQLPVTVTDANGYEVTAGAYNATNQWIAKSVRPNSTSTVEDLVQTGLYTIEFTVPEGKVLELDPSITGQTATLSAGVYSIEVTEAGALGAFILKDIHTVTLNANGGTFAEGTQTTFEVIHGNTYRTPYNFTVKLTNPGYTFAGWLVEGTETVYAYPTDITVNADTVLVAQWEVSKGDFVIRDAVEGFITADRTYKLVAEDGTEYTMTSTSYTGNYRQWRADDIENGTYTLFITEDGVQVSKDWILEKVGRAATVSSYVINADGSITFDLAFEDNYAATFIRYELNAPVEHTVTLDANGGTFGEGVVTTFEIVDGEIYKTPYPFSVKLTNPGYTFAGWLVEGTETVYAYPTDITVNADTVLVAQWVETVGDFVIHDRTDGFRNIDNTRSFKLVAEDGTEYPMTSKSVSSSYREWRVEGIPNGTYTLVVLENGTPVSKDWMLESFGHPDTTSSYVINEDGTMTFNLTFEDDYTPTFIRYRLNTVPVVVTSISVTNPIKVDYYIPDTELNLAGVVLTVNYSDGTSEVIEITEDMLSGYAFDGESFGLQEVTVTYEGLTDTFAIFYNRFLDVAHTHWNYDGITEAAMLGIINGYGNGYFGPSDTLTRGQAVVMLVRSLNVTIPEATESIFTDLPVDNWQTDAVMYAVEQGIVKGYDDGTFGSSKPITRGELAKMVAETYNLEIDNTNIVTFPDIPTTHWAYEYIQALASNNVVSGFEDGTYGANKYATRAEFTKFIMNALEVYNK